jgi:hypothetical protein
MRNRILVALAAIALANVVTPSTTATKRPGGGAELKRFGSLSRHLRVAPMSIRDCEP